MKRRFYLLILPILCIIACIDTPKAPQELGTTNSDSINWGYNIGVIAVEQKTNDGINEEHNGNQASNQILPNPQDSLSMLDPDYRLRKLAVDFGLSDTIIQKPKPKSKQVKPKIQVQESGKSHTVRNVAVAQTRATKAVSDQVAKVFPANKKKTND